MICLGRERGEGVLHVILDAIEKETKITKPGDNLHEAPALVLFIVCFFYQ